MINVRRFSIHQFCSNNVKSQLQLCYVFLAEIKFAQLAHGFNYFAVTDGHEHGSLIPLRVLTSQNTRNSRNLQ